MLRRILLGIAFLVLGVFAACEVGLGIPLPGAGYIALGLVFSVLLLRRAPIQRQKWPLTALALVYASLATLHFAVWSSREPFLRDFETLEVGMIEAEVRRIMGRHRVRTFVRRPFPAAASPIPFSTVGTVAPTAPAVHPNYLVLPDGLASSPVPEEWRSTDKTLVFLHPDRDADWGIVSIVGGKAAELHLSLD